MIVFFFFFFLTSLERKKRKKTHLGHSGGFSPVLRSGEDLFCCLWQSIKTFMFLPPVVVGGVVVVFLPC